MSDSSRDTIPSPHHAAASHALVQTLKDLGHDGDEIVSRVRANLMGNPQTGEVPHPYLTQVISLVENLIADTK